MRHAHSPSYRGSQISITSDNSQMPFEFFQTSHTTLRVLQYPRSPTMAAVTQDFTAEPVAKQNISHPLCPLTASEIATTADLLRSVWPPNTDLRFKIITLDEPPKKQMVPYLEASYSGAPLPFVPRKSFTSYYIRNTVSEPTTHRDWFLGRV